MSEAKPRFSPRFEEFAVRVMYFMTTIDSFVPMAGVAAAYGEEVDPAYELSIAAPYSQLRVLLLRAIAVVIVSVPLTVLAGLALRPWWVAVAWLRPLAHTLLFWYLDRRRPGPGRCRRCNYDLTGNLSGICPECGTATAGA